MSAPDLAVVSTLDMTGSELLQRPEAPRPNVDAPTPPPLAVVKYALEQIRKHAPPYYERDRELFHRAILGGTYEKFPGSLRFRGDPRLALRPVVGRVRELNIALWLFDDLQKVVRSTVETRLHTEIAVHAAELAWSQASLKKLQRRRPHAIAEAQRAKTTMDLISRTFDITHDVIVEHDGQRVVNTYLRPDGRLPPLREGLTRLTIPGQVSAAYAGRPRRHGRRKATAVPNREARLILYSFLSGTLGLRLHAKVAPALAELLRLYTGEAVDTRAVAEWIRLQCG